MSETKVTKIISSGIGTVIKIAIGFAIGIALVNFVDPREILGIDFGNRQIEMGIFLLICVIVFVVIRLAWYGLMVLFDRYR